MTAGGIRQLWFEIAAPKQKVEMYMFLNNCGLVHSQCRGQSAINVIPATTESQNHCGWVVPESPTHAMVQLRLPGSLISSLNLSLAHNPRVHDRKIGRDILWLFPAYHHLQGDMVHHQPIAHGMAAHCSVPLREADHEMLCFGRNYPGDRNDPVHTAPQTTSSKPL